MKLVALRPLSPLHFLLDSLVTLSHSSPLQFNIAPNHSALYFPKHFLPTTHPTLSSPTTTAQLFSLFTLLPQNQFGRPVLSAVQSSPQFRKPPSFSSLPLHTQANSRACMLIPLDCNQSFSASPSAPSAHALLCPISAFFSFHNVPRHTSFLIFLSHFSFLIRRSRILTSSLLPSHLFFSLIHH